MKLTWYHLGMDFIGPIAYVSARYWVEDFTSPDKTATSSNCIQGKDFIYQNGMKVFLFQPFIHMEIPPSGYYRPRY